MPDWSALVSQLYDALGTWRNVASACRVNGHQYSANTYRRIALGEIDNPGVAVRRGIVAALKDCENADVTGLHAPWVRLPRYGLTVRRDLGLRLKSVKNARGWTWDELMSAALERLEER